MAEKTLKLMDSFTGRVFHKDCFKPEELERLNELEQSIYNRKRQLLSEGPDPQTEDFLIVIYDDAGIGIDAELTEYTEGIRVIFQTATERYAEKVKGNETLLLEGARKEAKLRVDAVVRYYGSPEDKPENRARTHFEKLRGTLSFYEQFFSQSYGNPANHKGKLDSLCFEVLKAQYETLKTAEGPERDDPYYRDGIGIGYLRRSLIRPKKTPDDIRPSVSLKEYENILQNATVNTFLETKVTISKEKDKKGKETGKVTVSGKDLSVDQITGKIEVKRGDTNISITNYVEVAGLRVSSSQLLDWVNLIITNQSKKTPEVELSLDDYMKMRGIRDRKYARETLEEDLKTLKVSTIDGYEKRKKQKRLIGQMGFVAFWTWVGPRRDTVHLRLENEYFSLLKRGQICPYPSEIFRIDSRTNPNSYYLLRKLTEHKNMNIGQPNENIISVKSLLEAAPDIPKFEDVKAGDRAFTRRIIEPFERDMDAIKSLKWEYCHSKGVPLTDSELEKMNYKIFETLMVRVTWGENYPMKQQTRKIERRKRKIEETKKKKESKASPSEKEEKKAIAAGGSEQHGRG